MILQIGDEDRFSWTRNPVSRPRDFGGPPEIYGWLKGLGNHQQGFLAKRKRGLTNY